MRNVLLVIGAVLVLGGLAAWMEPSFTTEKTKEVAKFGDLTIQATDHETHTVPPAAAIGACVVGAVLLIVGLRSSKS